ncbi:MAG: hypothetical protein LIP05_15250 [Tannerellaceae bacterium]|nr:hypothetical protein [Tannerellaceae bacterium]
MIVEELRWISEDLLREADEAMPLFGGSNKKRWMAQYLDEVVNQDGSLLDTYLAYESKDEVLSSLEEEYIAAGHPKAEHQIPEKNDPDAKTHKEMDPMMDDRPAQPEYIDEAPEFHPGDLSTPVNEKWNSRS